MGYFRAEDTISGREGRAYATINGKVEEMFYVKTLEASVEKGKTEVKMLGHRGTQHKANGWKGTGSMTIYYVTTLFRQMMLDYIKTGKDAYFDIQIVNEDPASSIGKQTVVLKHVNLDKVLVGKVDTESEILDESIDFTFDDLDILDSFAAPSQA
ncbi:MAG TPA: phage tail tube protein [Bacilli bacterium]|nr:phage tail tube protein [Bacilli bacterium]